MLATMHDDEEEFWEEEHAAELGAGDGEPGCCPCPVSADRDWPRGSHDNHPTRLAVEPGQVCQLKGV